MYQLRVDTGGTFTDCWGKEESEETPRLVKVLSSGRMRVPVKEWISPRELILTLPENWKVVPGLFTGFKLESGAVSALVLAFGLDECRFTLSRGLPESATVDLFTREEAPVLGARLLTGTPLDREFPRLEMRLATTRGTNALLERKGAPVALFTTRGFADLPVIRDQRRGDLFALRHRRPLPLFSRVIEVEERLDANGEVLSPLRLDETFEASAAELLGEGVEVAAVALLNSYRNSRHEELLRDRLLQAGFAHVSLSSELAPHIKLLPRLETALANATLHPVMEQFLEQIQSAMGTCTQVLAMTSAGGLEPVSVYTPKDSLLSGPAGGVSGAAAVAGELGFSRVLTFDMGGTSTDVARYDGAFLYRFEQVVGDARVLSPALKIETVAAGGGSICSWKEGGLRVGPESAGADPGPACYGRSGPLTITDVNLLLGRIDVDHFGIPLTPENVESARDAAVALQREAGLMTDEPDDTFLAGLLDIAVEQMADAIRTISIQDGADPAEYAILAFGGAGPLHACDIAERLDVATVIIPAEAGLLSAYGLDRAGVERFAECHLNLSPDARELSKRVAETDEEAMRRLEETGFAGRIVRRLAEIRLAGQDATLTLEVDDLAGIREAFGRLYEETFGYHPPEDRGLEVVAYRAVAGTGRRADREVDLTGVHQRRDPIESMEECKFMERSSLGMGSRAVGPAVIPDSFSTLYLKKGWELFTADNGAFVITRDASPDEEMKERPEQIERELFRHRFDSLVEEMGAMLQRSAISTNVKERADFSCALLDGEGELITSAPHIPVHLGALGMCVRMVRGRLVMKPGDTVVTNHPAVGGSHLPDVTLITPVFSGSEGRGEAPLAYIANRAHHAEIGGITPGSMPPRANSLAEEGVVIAPTLLVSGGQSRLDDIAEILTGAPYPTRNLRDNLADLNAQLAANRRGQGILESLVQISGVDRIVEQMVFLKRRSGAALGEHLSATGFSRGEAAGKLDDGTVIRVAVEATGGRLKIDFTGSSREHPANLNATPAIVQSAVLYVLRLWTQSEVPLNEGMLDRVELVLPRCFLNPAFDDDARQCPAVVGGNVETSQRVVDTLLEALRVQACSQGTMNNFLFGDDDYGYYETIGGGAGAGEGYAGASGLHTHMTNTAITDPEILEARYPVRLLRFGLRRGSGGEGKWWGGDGLLREVEFLRGAEVSLLAQHRVVAPYGLAGGRAGACGRQSLNGKALDGIVAFRAREGDRLLFETPGGGGYGAKECEGP